MSGCRETTEEKEEETSSPSTHVGLVLALGVLFLSLTEPPRTATILSLLRCMIFVSKFFLVGRDSGHSVREGFYSAFGNTCALQGYYKYSIPVIPKMSPNTVHRKCPILASRMVNASTDGHDRHTRN
jgi:hypothetical protein